jgi:hypothetical protein
VIHTGDIGSVIRIVPETETDLSSAVSAEIRYKKPNGTTGSWEATIVDGGVQYVTQADDIDVAGTWYFQVYVDLIAWAGSSAIVSAKIGGSLA